MAIDCSQTTGLSVSVLRSIDDMVLYQAMKYHILQDGQVVLDPSSRCNNTHSIVIKLQS